MKKKIKLITLKNRLEEVEEAIDNLVDYPIEDAIEITDEAYKSLVKLNEEVSYILGKLMERITNLAVAKIKNENLEKRDSGIVIMERFLENKY